MWLLDANMDVHLVVLLAELGISCNTAGKCEWKTLSNGDLVAAAMANGYRCLRTRDRLFGESASRALNRFPGFAVVIVNLPQQRWQQYREQFIRTWEASPIRPIAVN
jgi:hypothetical protein